MTTRTQSISRTRQERQPFDAYNTPFDLALVLCKWLHTKGITRPARILEPSAGHGDFVHAAREIWPSAVLMANEIQPRLVEKPVMRQYLIDCAVMKKAKAPPPPVPTPTLDTRNVLAAAGANAVTACDFLTDPLWSTATPFDLVIGNPPYSQGGGAAAHTEKGIQLLAPGGVLAYLMKTHFVATEARIPFWVKHREMLACDPPIVPRPDFTGDGRDTSEYTFFVFEKPDGQGPHRWREWRAPAIQWKENNHG